MSTQRIRAWSALALAVLVGVLGLLVAGPAQAHSDLRSSDPADGATLATAPATVSFTFDENPCSTRATRSRSPRWPAVSG